MLNLCGTPAPRTAEWSHSSGGVRNHDPQRTPDAALANTAMLQELERRRKKKQVSTLSQQEAFRNAFDWDLISRQDPAIWEKILAFLQR